MLEEVSAGKKYVQCGTPVKQTGRWKSMKGVDIKQADAGGDGRQQ